MRSTHHTHRNRRNLLTLACIGVLGIGTAYGTVSCIFHETPHFVCGMQWRSVAQGAWGEEAQESTEILAGNQWVTGSACVNFAADAILQEGLTADCHLETTETGCGNATGCVWVPAFVVDGRATPVCMYDDDDYETAFRFIVADLIDRCVSEANSQGIDPYPCEEEDQPTCDILDHCTWNATISECEFNLDNCTNAAVKTTPVPTGDECATPSGECPGGGGTDTEAGLPDPSTVIAEFSGNQWEIDRVFFSQLMADQTLLLEDAARIEPWPYGGYYFTNVDQGSVAYALGFRSGDKIIKINGYYLGSLESAMVAWNAVKDLGSWVVTIQRGSTYYDFYYDLV